MHKTRYHNSSLGKKDYPRLEDEILSFFIFLGRGGGLSKASLSFFFQHQAGGRKHRSESCWTVLRDRAGRIPCSIQMIFVTRPRRLPPRRFFGRPSSYPFLAAARRFFPLFPDPRPMSFFIRDPSASPPERGYNASATRLGCKKWGRPKPMSRSSSYQTRYRSTQVPRLNSHTNKHPYFEAKI